MEELIKLLLEAKKISEVEANDLKEQYNSIVSQRDEARKESASRRVKLKELESYKKFAEDLALKNGLLLI